MKAAAKDTLELQGGKESDLNKINNENRGVHNVKLKTHDNIVIDAVALHMNHPSVTLRMKHAGNVENWATSNQYPAPEEIRILPDKEGMINPICILLRWVMKEMTTA